MTAPKGGTMRLTRALVVLTVLALFFSTGPAHADTGTFSVGSFSATYASGALHVQFTLKPDLGIYGWLGNNWPDTPVVVDLWRKKIAAPCGAQTHIAFLSWVNAPGTPFVTADVMDTGVEPGTTYQYYVTGISAQSGIMAPDAFIGYASTGVGLLCRGTLVTDPSCQGSSAWVHPCDNSCFGVLSFNDVPDEVWPYFGTPTTLAVYGEVNGLTGWCANVILPEFKISSVVEQGCVVATQPVTWGAVKAMYR